MTTEKIAKRFLPKTAPSYKPSRPFKARILSNEKITSEGSSDDVRHMLVDLGDSGLEYLEGQSVGVIPPGERADGRQHKVRLYSIASRSKGDEGKPNTLTLCVKRDEGVDAETGEPYRGLCSNYLCDAKEGDEILCTGPVGRVFLLPEDDSVPLILIATGTGIAPFRGFLDFARREKKRWAGGMDLFFGAKTKKELLYFNGENGEMADWAGDGDDFRARFALSRENPEDGKVYVQHLFEKEYERFEPLFQSGGFCLYLCGLKGIETGVEAVFKSRMGEEAFAGFKKKMRAGGRWNVEVY